MALCPERENYGRIRQQWLSRSAWWTSCLPIPQAVMDREWSDGKYIFFSRGFVEMFNLSLPLDEFQRTPNLLYLLSYQSMTYNLSFYSIRKRGHRQSWLRSIFVKLWLPLKTLLCHILDLDERQGKVPRRIKVSIAELSRSSLCCIHLSLLLAKFQTTATFLLTQLKKRIQTQI